MGKRFTNEQVEVAVNEYFATGSSTVAIEKLGYPSVTTLMKWVKLDKRWNKAERHYRQSSYETRSACVSAYLDGGESCRSIAMRYGTSATQVSRWAKAYLRSGPSALMPVQRRNMPISRRNDKVRPDPSPEPGEVRDAGLRDYCEQLKFENDILRAELDFFAKKARASAKKGSPTPKRRN